MDDTVLHEAEPLTVPDVPDAPLLRTILLTDICDSTTLVERLGDGGTAQFFREHDRLVLRLQQQWRGRLIDRADGLLLLFERPIDGLGFALDYARGLAAIGKLRHLDVRTRSGLHVGEVLSWRNADEAVRLGAKPIEVEGLAKPIAARLMSMARPGQLLMSSVAEPLAHRSARELGERGLALVWKSWGPWHFKGVPELQQVFEVGEPGLAPLRMPPDSPKAWRHRPLWRRPAVLAAEAALVAAITFGSWFATRPPPAIAFNERDWVVVADLRNLTGDARLDDSLEQAFRISLEQSRHVNVLSDLKVRDSLARMRLESGTLVDRDIASQIAQRDGARAVILPTVSEIGGRLRFSVEVVDPLTQTTVYARAADGKGEESVLASIDQVTSAVRANLGEAVKQIEHDSKPLPDVTTDNIDALRAYALAQQEYAKSNFDQASIFYERAVDLDPTFAVAWLGLVRVYYAQMQAPKAIAPLDKAKALRQRLPQREALYLDAWAARFDDPGRATSKWLELARLYPDYGPAQSNSAMWLFRDNRFSESLVFARNAIVPQTMDVAIDHDSVGRALLGMEQFDEADAAFREAIDLGYTSSWRRRLAVAAARSDFGGVEKLGKNAPAGRRPAYPEMASIAVDRGLLDEAKSEAEHTLKHVSGSGFDERAMRLPMAVISWLSGDFKSSREQALQVVQEALSARDAEYSADQENDAVLALGAALLMQRLGDVSMSEKVIARIDGQSHPSTPVIDEYKAVLAAEAERVRGRPEKAVAILRPLLTGSERFQTRAAFRRALTDAGEEQAAREQTGWLKHHRGQAYVEMQCGFCLQTLNVADSTGLMPIESIRR